MRRKRKDGKELFYAALVAFGLGIFNMVVGRYIDGSLCLVAGAVCLIIRRMKRRR